MSDTPREDQSSGLDDCGYLASPESLAAKYEEAKVLLKLHTVEQPKNWNLSRILQLLHEIVSCYEQDTHNKVDAKHMSEGVVVVLDKMIESRPNELPKTCLKTVERLVEFTFKTQSPQLWHDVTVTVKKAVWTLSRQIWADADKVHQDMLLQVVGHCLAFIEQHTMSPELGQLRFKIMSNILDIATHPLLGTCVLHKYVRQSKLKTLSNTCISVASKCHHPDVSKILMSTAVMALRRRDDCPVDIVITLANLIQQTGLNMAPDALTILCEYLTELFAQLNKIYARRIGTHEKATISRFCKTLQEMLELKALNGDEHMSMLEKITFISNLIQL